ncbi:MAG: aspartate-semialdehyde dehydrogenase, partial [Ruminococcaceae bacterium]|nr:aspartate-semialdehyde dehydrogenase [Oscillospiraceae bacterium]
VYSTYQAVSGAGVKGYDDLQNGAKAFVNCDGSKSYELEKFPYPIFDNCIPHIDVFLENGYTKEEQKMIEETRKIMGDDSIKITATCVRVPVFYSHSESINLELKKPYEVEDIKKLLASAPGTVVVDDPASSQYPLASVAAGTDEVYVGRIRRDDSVENGLNLWVVADNIRKGAASNAVQIAKLLIDKKRS